MKFQKKSLVISATQAGLAIDRALLQAGWGLSRRKIRQILDAGGVRVNRRSERFASYKVRVGDHIEVQYVLEELTKRAQPVAIDRSAILYDKHGLIAINKPPGLASQPTRAPEIDHVVSALHRLLQADRLDTPLFLCHRLDKETSGVLLLARSEERATEIMVQFKARTVRKRYLALCYGVAAEQRWECTGYLSKLHPKTGLVHEVRSGGNWAQTGFETLAVNKRLKVSLVACYPSTGRTHQIRVHLALSQLPIVGDKKYMQAGTSLPAEFASLTLAHHFLHAESLSFNPQPQGKQSLTLTAPLPDLMQRFCKQANLLNPSKT